LKWVCWLDADSSGPVGIAGLTGNTIN
jgi:hypothetical protein